MLSEAPTGHAGEAPPDLGDQARGSGPGRVSRSCAAAGRSRRRAWGRAAQRRRRSRWPPRPPRRGHTSGAGCRPACRPSSVPTVSIARPCRVGGQQLRRPRVIADAVDDRQLGVGHGARVGRRRLVGVGVLGGVDDDALHAGAACRRAGGRCAPEVLGRHHAHAVGAWRPRQRPAAARSQQARAGAGGRSEDRGTSHDRHPTKMRMSLILIPIRGRYSWPR